MVQINELPIPVLPLFKGSAVQSHLIDDVVKIYPELPGEFPIIYKAAHEDVSLLAWLKEYHVSVEKDILYYGAGIFKGFPDVMDVESFQNAFSVIYGSPLSYQFRTSPRSEVGNNMYTSTDHPADQVIHMHTESSYSASWPRNLGFFCHTPSLTNGETPIANERKIIAHLPADVLAKFEALQILYVRNFSKGLGLPWQNVFQTDDKQVVEAYLQKEKINFDWKAGDTLRMEWKLPAFRKHPVTRERLWFNHMYFGHKSLYDAKVLKVVPENYLPFLTYFGDGSVIEDEIINTMRKGYDSHSIVFPWEKGDFIILENMIFSHGRRPFSGNRKIIVAMGNEVDGASA